MPLASQPRSPAPRRLKWSRGDLVLVAMAVIGLAVTASLAVAGTLGTGVDPGLAGREAVATVTWASARARRRSSATLVWRDLVTADLVYHRDSIFVPEAGVTRLALADGGTIEVDESSLVVVERPPAPETEPSSVRLVSGSMVGIAGARGLRIAAAGGRATLAAGAEAQVIEDVGGAASVRALSGTTTLDGAAGRGLIAAGESSGFDATGALIPTRRPTCDLVAPARNAWLSFEQEPPILALRWQGLGEGASLQVADDVHFGQIIATTALAGDTGTVTFTPPAAGSYWWRIVDREEHVTSEIRKLVVARAVAPVVIAPREGAVVIVPPGRGFPLSWNEVEGYDQYEVQFSHLRSFASPRESRHTPTTQIWFGETEPEATYFWRVRATHATGEASPFSPVASFRLTRAPVLEAPFTREAEIRERGDAGKP